LRPCLTLKQLEYREQCGFHICLMILVTYGLSHGRRQNIFCWGLGRLENELKNYVLNFYEYFLCIPSIQDRKNIFFQILANVDVNISFVFKFLFFPQICWRGGSICLLSSHLAVPMALAQNQSKERRFRHETQLCFYMWRHLVLYSHRRSLAVILVWTDKKKKTHKYLLTSLTYLRS
jgi:hypothetical protein